VKLSLLSHLACPQCGNKMRVNSHEVVMGTCRSADDISQGVLFCHFMHHSYEIVKGVPVLIPPNMSADQTQVAEAFARKWGMIPNYGHDVATRDFQHEWYLQRFGWKTTDHLKQFLETKERILDAGCGLGRDVKLYAESTRGTVFGVDISDGVLLAQEKLGHLPNVHIVKADMTRLPFPADYFDFIACDQALHHTPNTHDSFMKLVHHLRPRGHIAVYVYSKKGIARETADDLMRKYTTEMSHDDCVTFSAACAIFGQMVSKLNLEMQRDIYWNVFKCFWNKDYDFSTNVAINFDWYRPKYAWRHTPEEVRIWCEEAGLFIEHFDICDSGISVRGYKT